MSATIQNSSQLSQVLLGSLEPNPQTRQAAEKALMEFQQSPACVPAFLQQIQTHPHAGAKQMAAVLMRKQITKHWKKLGIEQREQIKKGLLDVGVKERTSIVRSAIVHVMGEVGRFEVPGDGWKELGGYLQNCVTSENEGHRILGIGLFSALLETVPVPMKKMLPQIIQVFQNGLKDRVSSVQSAAVTGMVRLVLALTTPEEFQQFLALVTPLISVLEMFMRNEPTSDTVMSVFEILDELLAIDVDESVMKQLIPPLVNLYIKYCADEKLEPETRDRVATSLGWVVKYHVTCLLESNLINPCIDLAMSMLCHPEEDDSEPDSITIHKAGSSLLDEIAVIVPSKHTFNKLINMIVPLLNNPNPFHRKAGIVALGVISEGCNELMKENISKFVPMAVACSKDQHIQVRAAGITAIVNFVEYLEPHVAVHYKELFPVIMKGLEDQHSEVRQKACYALDSLCVNLQPDDTVHYLQSFLLKLMNMLQQSNRELQKVILTTIGSLAKASKKHFLQYLEKTVGVLQQVMVRKEKENLSLRARATETIGIIAESVGKEALANQLPGFLALALENFQLPDGHDLKEYSFSLFGSFVQVMKADFAPYLTQVLPLIYTTIKAPDGFIDPEEYLSGEVDGTHTIEPVKMEVRTSVLDEKQAAILALGDISKHVGLEHFAGHFAKSISILSSYTDHFHPAIRRPAMAAMKCVGLSIIPVPSPNPMPSNLQEIVNTLVEVYINRMVVDDEMEVVSAACESLASLIKEIGSIASRPFIGELIQTISNLLLHQAECFEGYAELDDQDHDVVLSDSVSDLIDEVARSLGPDFEVHFQKLYPIMKKYISHSAVDDRVMAIGTVAEVSKALGPRCASYADDMIPIALNSAKETNFNVKRNSLFCLGVFAQFAPGKTERFLNDIVSTLSPVFQQKDSVNKGLLDNASGCMSRLIFSYTNHLPLDQMIPVLLSALPLKEDFLENDAVHACFFKLLETRNPAAGNHLQGILDFFGSSLGNSNVNGPVQQKIVEIVRQNKNQWSSVIQQCNQQTQQKFQQIQ